MSSRFFDNPGSTAGFEQYHASMNAIAIEFGIFAFTTTGATVEVPTYMSTIKACVITPYKSSALGATFNETLSCDLAITSGQVTVSRVSGTYAREMHFPIDEDHIGNDSTYDLDTHPLFIAQEALTLTALEIYTGTKFGSGDVKLNLGDSGNDDEFIADAKGDLVITNYTNTITSFTSASVSDGDVVTVNTNTGGTSGPSDVVVSIAATETAQTLTSALGFTYMFLGFH